MYIYKSVIYKSLIYHEAHEDNEEKIRECLFNTIETKITHQYNLQALHVLHGKNKKYSSLLFIQPR